MDTSKGSYGCRICVHRSALAADHVGGIAPAGEGLVAALMLRVVKAVSACSFEDMENWGFYPDTVDDGEEEWLGLAQQEFVSEIESWLRPCFGPDEEWMRLGWFEDEGRRYLLTGGSTWGDDPSDDYRYFVYLNCLKVTKEPLTDLELRVA